MKIIVGLGNPGEKYVGTRHNLGFDVVNKLADSVQRIENSWKPEKKFKAEILQSNYTLNAKPCTLLLVKPQTYMNNSGLAVKLLTTYYKLPVSPRGGRGEPATDLIVVHDDLDLPLGKIKVRLGGSSGGHKGVDSIIKSLGTDQFIRVRLGISTPIKHHDIEKFVIEPFLSTEKSTVKQMVKKAVLAVELLLDQGLEAAQNQYN